MSDEPPGSQRAQAMSAPRVTRTPGTTRRAPVARSTRASRAEAPDPAFRYTASQAPAGLAGEKAPPRAKPPGSGLCTVVADRVAVLVTVSAQQRAGSQARRLYRAPGGV